jgi:hypothetical protein
VVAVAAGSTLLLGGVANASPPAPGSLGTLAVNPATGTDLTAAAAQLPVACPTDSASMNVSIIGPVAADGTVAQTATFVTPYPIVPNAIPSTSGEFSTPFVFDFKDAAADRGGSSNLMQAGQYNFTATCTSRTLAGLGTFTGAIYFTSPTAYTSTNPNPSATTSTVLTTSPASSAPQGTTVTLNAAITPTPSSATVTGTVQFKDGTSNIGSPVTVGTGGTASTTTSTLTAVSHQLTAVFTSTANNVTGSTSAPVTFVVGSVGAPTTTTLSVTPSGSVTQGTAVTLNGSVSPTTAAGSIQFTDNGTNLGQPVAVSSNGTASTSTSTLTAAGSPHSLVANFVPTDPAAFATSSSQPVSLLVTTLGGGTGSSATERITTTIAAGSLVISVADTNVVLPTPVLNTAGTLFTTSGKINTVTVTDTRGADPGWSVSGQVTDFSDGASHAINGGNLGWVPNVVDKAASQTVTAGGTIAPANGIAPGVTPPSGVGLSSSRTLATAAAAAGTGTAHLDALLNLNAPTSTPAGTYNATLTLTAI